MWEYRWVEVEAGDDRALTALGLEEWEAVSSTLTGEAFGRKYVSVLMKRAAAPRAVVDLASYEAGIAQPRAAV